MSDETKINTEYEPESHLPPFAIGEVSSFTEFWQRRFRRTHDKDGTHNDPLVPHAWAICNLTGGGATVLDAEGVTSVTRLGAGLVEVVLDLPLIVDANDHGWQILGWVYDDAGSGRPYFAYEDPVTSPKDDSTTCLQIIDKDANPYDLAFALAVYGLRA